MALAARTVTAATPPGLAPPCLPCVPHGNADNNSNEAYVVVVAVSAHVILNHDACTHIMPMLRTIAHHGGPQQQLGCATASSMPSEARWR